MVKTQNSSKGSILSSFGIELPNQEIIDKIDLKLSIINNLLKTKKYDGYSTEDIINEADKIYLYIIK